MPTTYTSLLGFALPATGELSGTWGDTVNDYITKYVDASVAGVQTISGTQTAVTLSVTNGATLTSAGSGATGSAQYSIINCTGNPASALTITAPASSRQYIVVNATSTTQPVKLVGTGPTTGVTIPSGRAALVTWNGSDYVSAQTCIISNDAGATAGPIFDLMRDSASPAASDILGQLLFSGRDSAGNVQTYSYIQAGIEDATSTSEDGNIQFLTVTNGTASEKMRIDAAGSVGIGTSSPTNILSLGGNSARTFWMERHTTANTAGNTLTIQSGGATSGATDKNGGNLLLQSGTATGTGSSAITFSTATAGGTGTTDRTVTEKMRIDGAGILGLGVTPSAWSGTTALELPANGMVSAKGGIYLLANAYYNGSFRYTTTAAASSYTTGSGGHFWNIAASGTAGNAITFTQAMTLDSSGNLGIGTTSPSSYAQLASVISTSGSSGWFESSASTTTLVVKDTGSNGANINLRGNGATTPNKTIRAVSGALAVVNSAYTAEIVQITDGGAAYNTTGTWGTISDLRVKENIVDARGYLDDLCKLRVVKYSLKSENALAPTKLGLIAQEVEQVFPALVESSVSQFDGLDDLKQIKLSVLTPMLLKAIQEQQAIIQSLTARIAALESKGA